MATLLQSVTALLFGVGLLLLGHGMLLTVVPLRAVSEAFTSLQIGLLGSAYYLGFAIGCLATPYVILRAGHIRTFAALVALAATSALVLPLAIAFPTWFLARMLTGISLAGLFLVIESWLNDRASNHNRGLVFAAYIAANYGAIAIGQLLVAAGDPMSFQLFILAGVAIALATIPVALTRSAQPAPIALVRFRPIELFRNSPVGVVGVTMIGLATGAFWTLAAVFAVGSGLTDEEAALFVGVAVIGGVLAQWPVGRLSDRFDRRLILLALLLTSSVVGLALAFLPLSNMAIIIGAFPLGATLLSCYSIAVAHAFDHADRSSFVETSAGLLFANGLGSMVGPIAAALLMGAIGSGGLFAFAALAFAVLAAFVYYRLRRSPPVAAAEKTDFSVGATSQAGAVLAAGPYDPEMQDIVMPEPYEPAVADDEGSTENVSPAGESDSAEEPPPDDAGASPAPDMSEPPKGPERQGPMSGELPDAAAVEAQDTEDEGDEEPDGNDRIDPGDDDASRSGGR